MSDEAKVMTEDEMARAIRNAGLAAIGEGPLSDDEWSEDRYGVRIEELAQLAKARELLGVEALRAELDAAKSVSREWIETSGRIFQVVTGEECLAAIPSEVERVVREQAAEVARLKAEAAKQAPPAPQMVEPLTGFEIARIVTEWMQRPNRNAYYEQLAEMAARAQREKARPVDVATKDPVRAAVNVLRIAGNTAKAIAAEEAYELADALCAWANARDRQSAPPQPAQGEGAPLVHSAVAVNEKVEIIPQLPGSLSVVWCDGHVRAVEMAKALTAARMPAQKGGETP